MFCIGTPNVEARRAIRESPTKAPSGSSEAKPRALNECPVDIQNPRCPSPQARRLSPQVTEGECEKLSTSIG